MIVGLDIENFRGIRSTNGPVPLSRFHLLVGPNGGGKSTFLDAFAFIRDCLDDRVGPRQAVRNRAPNPADLTYLRRGGDIRLGFWLADEEDTDRILYRVVIGWDPVPGVVVRSEDLSRVPAERFESIEDLRLKPDTGGAERRLLYQEKGYHVVVPEDYLEEAPPSEDEEHPAAFREGEPAMPREPYRIERDPHRPRLHDTLRAWFPADNSF